MIVVNPCIDHRYNNVMRAGGKLPRGGSLHAGETIQTRYIRIIWSLENSNDSIGVAFKWNSTICGDDTGACPLDIR
jgi:hypothetical protein